MSTTSKCMVEVVIARIKNRVEHNLSFCSWSDRISDLKLSIYSIIIIFGNCRRVINAYFKAGYRHVLLSLMQMQLPFASGATARNERFRRSYSVMLFLVLCHHNNIFASGQNKDTHKLRIEMRLPRMCECV